MAAVTGKPTARAPRQPALPRAKSLGSGYLTLEHVAKYMDCSTKTVRRCIAQGLQHYYVRLGGHKRGILLFRQGDIDRWLRRFRRGTAAESKGETS